MGILTIKTEALLLNNQYGILDAVRHVKNETGLSLQDSKSLVDKWVLEPLTNELEVLKKHNILLTEALQKIKTDIQEGIDLPKTHYKPWDLACKEYLKDIALVLKQTSTH